MTVLLGAVATTLAVAGGVALGQIQGSDDPVLPVAVESAEPAWRDLDRARQDLKTAVAARDSVQGAISRITGELNHEMGRLDQLGNADTGRRLLESEARQLVVQEYMHGGHLEDLVFVLGVSEATDAIWRNALLSEVAEVVGGTLVATGDVPGERQRTEARIGRLRDAVPYLNDRLVDAEQSVAAAEWVVYIAEINDLADRELAANGWIEPTERHWYNLRWCESRNNYSIESSNGLFYGAYQFEPRTWRTVGGTGNPAHAPPEEQDARARLLYARRGAQPWPRDYCGRWLP
ncbi:transglycosylase family protein [Candidatus Poriferisocius sp.]|uniref:transglycosylase family protein n=1 Tax=Candidatus Poriferisocius sp. TaxID=3101276 RepID=UPI003B020E4B